jgi:hypothetical protein
VNVLSEEKKQQIIALGKLGWSLRRIERTVHIRRETAAGYLKAAGVPVRPPGGWGLRLGLLGFVSFLDAAVHAHFGESLSRRV